MNVCRVVSGRKGVNVKCYSFTVLVMVQELEC